MTSAEKVLQIKSTRPYNNLNRLIGSLKVHMDNVLEPMQVGEIVELPLTLNQWEEVVRVQTIQTYVCKFQAIAERHYITRRDKDSVSGYPLTIKRVE